jgi:sugar lactone lactonase YvrE
MRVIASVAVVSACSLAACGGGEQPAADSTPAATPATPAAPAVAESAGDASEGFRTPESVRYDAELDVWYVSNINGGPSAKDGNGSISRVEAGNPHAITVLVEGGKNGATLHGPKGMALAGDTLWVADIDAVRGFDRRTGAPLATVDLSKQGAQFLNDVVVGPDGALRVTDTGIRISEQGEITHPGTDRVFRIAGGAAMTVVQGDSLGRPNGIAWDAANARWLIVSFGDGRIRALRDGDTTLTTIATGPGTHDGVEVLADGRVLITSWADSAVHVLDGTTLTRLVTGVEAPADIGVDTKRNVLAVPRFNAGRVEYFRIPPR